MRHAGTFLFVLVCSLFVWVGTLPAGEVVDRIVAVVNGEIITLYDVRQQSKPFLEKMQQDGAGELKPEQVETAHRNVLNLLIDELLIKQEADKLGLEVTDLEIQNRIRQIKDQNNLTDEQFDNSLIVQGLTREQYEDKLKDEIRKHKLLGYMVRRKVVITDQEIEEFYKKNASKFTAGNTVSLKLLLVPVTMDAQDLKKRITNGELTFEEAVQNYSVGPRAEEGGTLGEFEWSDLAEDWKDVLGGLETGDISDPFPFNNHQALLKVDARENGEMVALDSVRDEIYDQLHQPQLEKRFSEYVQNLRKKAVIDVRL
ncbi:MAG: SurA N-terminal domain-containing protein [bacterium]